MAFLTKIFARCSKIIRFASVGTLGTGINAILYYGLTEFVTIPTNGAAVLAFFIAIASNYLLNHCWTFAAVSTPSSPSFIGYVKYVLANLTGLVCNLIMLNAVILFFGRDQHMYGQFMGVLVGMVFNFVFVSKFVFRTRQHESQKIVLTSAALSMVKNN